MSNVYKASENKEVKTRELFIRNLETPPVETADEETQLIVKSRNLIVRQHQIEQEKKALEQERLIIEKLKEQTVEELALLKEEWENEKIALEQQAYEEGFQAGFTDGRNKALADMDESLQKANEITEKSKVAAEDYIDSQERVILEIAIRSANRILNETLSEDEEKFLPIVRRAILEVREMKEIKLYVSQKFYPLVTDHRSELTALLPPDTPFLIFVNEDFEDDECYVETNHGRIVVTIDEQLEELRERLIELIEQGD